MSTPLQRSSAAASGLDAFPSTALGALLADLRRRLLAPFIFSRDMVCQDISNLDFLTDWHALPSHEFDRILDDSIASTRYFTQLLDILY